jgi:hypothetical protein
VPGRRRGCSLEDELAQHRGPAGQGGDGEIMNDSPSPNSRWTGACHERCQRRRGPAVSADSKPQPAIQELLVRLGHDERAARELHETLAFCPEAGLTVEKFAAAASSRSDRSLESTVFKWT